MALYEPPLEFIAKVSDAIGFALQEAERESRPLSAYGMAKALYAEGVLRVQCPCCVQNLFTTWLGHGSTCMDCEHDSALHGAVSR